MGHVVHLHVRVLSIAGGIFHSTELKSFESTYDAFIMHGEMVRSICVNVGIYPDQHDGVINNIRLWSVTEQVYHRQSQEEYAAALSCPSLVVPADHRLDSYCISSTDSTNSSSLYLLLIELAEGTW